MVVSMCRGHLAGLQICGPHQPGSIRALASLHNRQGGRPSQGACGVPLSTAAGFCDRRTGASRPSAAALCHPSWWLCLGGLEPGGPSNQGSPF